MALARPPIQFKTTMPYKAPETLEELDAIVGIKSPAPMKIGGAAGRSAPGRLVPMKGKAMPTKGKPLPTKLEVPPMPNPIEEDLPQLDLLKDRFSIASTKHGIPVEVLAAIASRESRAGKHLDASGYDPQKKAYGIMQIDERYHKRRGKKPDSQEHINQAAEILAKNKKQIDADKRFAKWTEEQRLQAAVAAYNFGVGNVRTWENLDVGTIGNDYSADVMNRAKAYRDRLVAGK